MQYNSGIMEKSDWLIFEKKNKFCDFECLQFTKTLFFWNQKTERVNTL